MYNFGRQHKIHRLTEQARSRMKFPTMSAKSHPIAKFAAAPAQELQRTEKAVLILCNGKSAWLPMAAIEIYNFLSAPTEGSSVGVAGWFKGKPNAQQRDVVQAATLATEATVKAE